MQLLLDPLIAVLPRLLQPLRLPFGLGQRRQWSWSRWRDREEINVTARSMKARRLGGKPGCGGDVMRQFAGVGREFARGDSPIVPAVGIPAIGTRPAPWAIASPKAVRFNARRAFAPEGGVFAVSTRKGRSPDSARPASAASSRSLTSSPLKADARVEGRANVEDEESRSGDTPQSRQDFIQRQPGPCLIGAGIGGQELDLAVRNDSKHREIHDEWPPARIGRPHDPARGGSPASPGPGMSARRPSGARSRNPRIRFGPGVRRAVRMVVGRDRNGQDDRRGVGPEVEEQSGHHAGKAHDGERGGEPPAAPARAPAAAGRAAEDDFQTSCGRPELAMSTLPAEAGVRRQSAVGAAKPHVLPSPPALRGRGQGEGAVSQRRALHPLTPTLSPAKPGESEKDGSLRSATNAIR